MTLNLPEVPHGHLARAPLKAVLGQLKFPPVLRVQELDFIAPFQEAIRSEYPNLGRQQEIGVIVAPGGIIQTQPTSAWRSPTRTGTWHVVLASDFVTLEATASNYTQFDDLRQRLESVLHHLIELFAIPIATRLGLRYVNHIELSEGRALLEARQLIRPELLGPAGLDLFADELTAAVSDLRLTRPDGTLAIKHGMVPAGMPPQGGYLLDFDYFVEAAIDLSVSNLALGQLQLFHDVIYRLFHWCITDEARGRFGWEQE